MSKRFLFLGIFALTFLTSCNGPSFSFATEPTPTPSPPPAELTLVGYNYTIKDVGEGWNQGSVSLALQNNTSRHAGFDVTKLQTAVIETSEGQPYEGKIGYEWWEYFNECKEFDKVEMVPPSTRVYVTCTQQGGISVRFRFAYAAHPIAITFPGTKQRIDLSTATQPFGSGFVGDPSSIKSILAEYNGRVLVDEPNGAKVTVKGCNFISVLSSFNDSYGTNLALEIQNRNKFQETAVTVTLPQKGERELYQPNI